MSTTRRAFSGSLLVAVILACVGSQAFCFPIKAKDDRGKEFEFSEPPRRIVSLVPTQTELLFSLGLDKEIVGVTAYCTFPEAARSKEKVGGFADFDIDKISALNPDLVLSFGTIQLPAVEALEKRGKKVFWIYPRTVNDILASFERVGEITGKAQEGKRLRMIAEQKIAALRNALGTIPEKKRPTIYRVMAINPPATIGADSFQTDIFSLAGGKNVFGDVKRDYYEVDAQELIKRDPDVVVICGNDENLLRQKLLESPVYAKLTAVKSGSVMVIPCDFICRPGQHVVETAERIARYLHHDSFSDRPEKTDCSGTVAGPQCGL